jgi:methionyl-tRNA formyltransferase
MSTTQNINVICNSNLAIPALHELIRLGRLQSVAMSQQADESRQYIESMAGHYGIPFLVFSKENLKEQMEQWLKSYPCVAVFCLTFPYKIPEATLAVPPLGFINFHFALLPNYRGASPVFWQIKNREPFGGITVHQMDAGWDTGAILATHRVPIGDHETHGMHWSKIALEGRGAVAGLLSKMDSGMPMQGQVQTGGAYYQKPTYNDVKLDWAKNSSVELLATIKACNPWNKGAFTFVNGREVRIVEATVADSFYGMPCGAPGTVRLAPDGKTFAISCNDSTYIKPEIIYCDEGFITPETFIRMGVSSNSIFH